VERLRKEDAEEARAHLSGSVAEFCLNGTLPSHPGELAKLRQAAIDRAKALNRKTLTGEQNMSAEELMEFNQLSDLSRAAADKLQPFGGNNSLSLPSSHIVVGGKTWEPGGHANYGDYGDKRFAFHGLAEYIVTGEGGVKASLTEGGSLQYNLPGHEVLPFLHA